MRRWIVMAVGLLAAASGGLGFAAETPPGAEPEASRVLARVNQVEITYGELQARLASVRQQGPVSPDRRGELLRALVREEILFQGALADRLDQDTAFKTRMQQIRRQVLIEELLKRKVLDLVRVTEEETRKMYEDNRTLLTTETVGVSHIMVKTQAEAEAIRQELVAGKEFGELARGKSQDAASAEKGGDLGNLGRGQTEPEFEEAAFNLKEGELSPVVKTQYGYHIIKAGPRKGVTQPYDEVKDRIQQTLVQQKQRDAFLAYMAELEKQTQTEVFEDRLR